MSGETRADPQSRLGDWRPVTAPDGRVFYFNSRTDETSWVPPKPLPAASGTHGPTPASPPPYAPPPMQNPGSPPIYQNANSHAASFSSPNNGSYPPPLTSTNGNSFPPQPAQTFYAQHPSPAYRQPPGPPPPQQPPRPEYPRTSTSFKSLLGSAVKAALFPGQFDPSQYGNPGYAPQGPIPNAAGPMSAPGPTPPSTPNTNGRVIVNSRPLDQQSLLRLQVMGVRIVPGRYWYDSRCGAWGMESGPCLGAIAAGQSLGGPLRADASGPSSTGVFINGRQIHALDALRLQAMGITPIPGRWWVEADGRYGLEGSFVTLGTLAMGSMASQGSGSSSWSNGDSFGGQGDTFGYVGGHDSTGRAWCVDYGS